MSKRMEKSGSLSFSSITPSCGGRGDWAPDHILQLDRRGTKALADGEWLSITIIMEGKIKNIGSWVVKICNTSR